MQNSKVRNWKVGVFRGDTPFDSYIYKLWSC